MTDPAPPEDERARLARNRHFNPDLERNAKGWGLARLGCDLAWFDLAGRIVGGLLLIGACAAAFGPAVALVVAIGIATLFFLPSLDGSPARRLWGAPSGDAAGPHPWIPPVASGSVPRTYPRPSGTGYRGIADGGPGVGVHLALLRRPPWAFAARDWGRQGR